MLKAGFVGQRLSESAPSSLSETKCTRRRPHASWRFSKTHRMLGTIVLLGPIPSLSSCSPALPSAATTQKPNFADPRPPGQLRVVKGCLGRHISNTNMGEKGRYIQWESWGPRIVVQPVYTYFAFEKCHILPKAALCDDTRV